MTLRRRKNHKMEDLTLLPTETGELVNLPDITQYKVRLPFRIAVVGQTDSGKTHLIMKRWLGGKVSFWGSNNEGLAIETELQHCLFCSNGGMLTDEKTLLRKEFVKDGGHCQKLFHINRFPQKQEIFEFIAKTTTSSQQQSPPATQQR